MDKIGIYISAYTAEKTLANTLNSVLAQTYKDYIVIIGDNGSTDNTSEIIKSYCQQYDFIYFYRHKKNFSGSFMASLYGFNLMNNYNDVFYYTYNAKGDVIYKQIDVFNWICFVDSDDTIEPTYLEDMLSYAKKNNLDMVTCGWSFVRPDRTDLRVPESNEVIYKKDYAEKLSYYDKFMGPVWNKLFKRESMAKNITYYENKFSKLFKDGVYFYGADTAYNYLYLGNDLEKFGLISKSLYNYSIHDESVSRKSFNPMRIVADRRMAEVRFDFLQEIGEKISEENRDFIMNIYYKSMKATMDLLMNDDRYDLNGKMRHLYEMYSYSLLDAEFKNKEVKYL